MKNEIFLRRFRNAINGIAAGLRTERSLRTHVLAALLALGALIYFRPEPIWWGLVGLIAVLVIAAELMNTALEELCNLVEPNHHPQIKIIKDLAAGAVLVVSIGALWIALWFAIAHL